MAALIFDKATRYEVLVVEFDNAHTVVLALLSQAVVSRWQQRSRDRVGSLRLGRGKVGSLKTHGELEELLALEGFVEPDVHLSVCHGRQKQFALVSVTLVNRGGAHGELGGVRVTQVFENMVHVSSIDRVTDHAHTLSTGEVESATPCSDFAGPQLESFGLSDVEAALLSGGGVHHGRGVVGVLASYDTSHDSTVTESVSGKEPLGRGWLNQRDRGYVHYVGGQVTRSATGAAPVAGIDCDKWSSPDGLHAVFVSCEVRMRLHIFNQELDTRVSGLQDRMYVGSGKEGRGAVVVETTGVNTGWGRVTGFPVLTLGAVMQSRPWRAGGCVDHDIINGAFKAARHFGCVMWLKVCEL